MTTRKNSTLLSTKEANRLLELSLEIADLAEQTLESRGAYSKEFTEGLERSIKESKSGKVKKISSLSELN